MTEVSRWSFSAGTLGIDDQTHVTVLRVSDGQELTNESEMLERFFGPDTLAFDPPGWDFDETYEVRVFDVLDGSDRVTVVYRTTPTQCF
jgi:hypothetical protein